MNVTVTTDRNLLIPLDAVVGTFRSFGCYGPTYQILRLTEPATGNEVRMHIRVVESGEELDYPLSDVLDDPLAR